MKYWMFTYIGLIDGHAYTTITNEPISEICRHYGSPLLMLQEITIKEFGEALEQIELHSRQRNLMDAGVLVLGQSQFPVIKTNY